MKETENTLIWHGQTHGASHLTCQRCVQCGILLRFCDHQLYFRGPVGVVCQWEVLTFHWRIIGNNSRFIPVIILIRLASCFSYSKHSTAVTFLNSIWSFVWMCDRFYAYTHMLHRQIFFQNALNWSIQDVILFAICSVVTSWSDDMTANCVHIFVVPWSCWPATASHPVVIVDRS